MEHLKHHYNGGALITSILQQRKDEVKRAGQRSKKRWIKENTLKLGLKFNRNTDPDIIARLEMVENKTAYIKQLIRDDIAKNPAK